MNKIFAFRLLLTMAVIQIVGTLSASGNEDGGLRESPIVISIQYRDPEVVVLKLSNSLNRELKLVSNIPQVLNLLFLGFPTEGGLQFRDPSGEGIALHNQSADGWWNPRYSSSSLELEKEKRLKKMSEIIIKANDAKEYPIRYRDVLKLAMASRVSEKVETMQKFRVRLPIVISGRAEKKINVTIISKWIQIPDDR